MQLWHDMALLEKATAEDENTSNSDGGEEKAEEELEETEEIH